MFERFTDRARAIVVSAEDASRGFGHCHIGTEHLLMGLLCEGNKSFASEALVSRGLSLENVREMIEEIVDKEGSTTHSKPPFTPRAKQVLQDTLHVATIHGHTAILPEHILLSILHQDMFGDGNGIGALVLLRLGIDNTGDLYREVIETMQFKEDNYLVHASLTALLTQTFLMPEDALSSLVSKLSGVKTGGIDHKLVLARFYELQANGLRESVRSNQ